MSKSISILARFFSLLLLAGLCLSAVGCKGKAKIVEEVSYVYESGAASAKTDETNTEDSNPSKEENGDSASSKASGTSSSKSKSSSTKSGNSQAKANNLVNDGINPEDYRGKTVTYATWKNPYQNEDGDVVKSFEKTYGIKVKIDTTPQATYVQEVVGKIAAGNAPDVVFDNCFFPASTSILQPINEMKLKTSESIWDQGMLNMSKINGKSYLVNTVGNIWAEVDCLFYNKKIFADNNITTPEEYYKANKWNFAALEKCMSELKSANLLGAHIDIETLLASTGASFYKFSNGKFSNGVTTMTKNVLMKISEWTKSGYIRPATEHNLINNFITGKAGIAITNAYGLKKTGYFSKMNPDQIGFTYIPAYDANTPTVSCGLFRGWGLCRGAKEPVAAGLFLRYYLDTNNYKVSSAFINSEAQSFFFKLTSGVKSDSKNPYLLLGVTEMCSEKVIDYTGLTTFDPNQVSGQVDSYNNRINTNAEKLNTQIEKNLAAYK